MLLHGAHARASCAALSRLCGAALRWRPATRVAGGGSNAPWHRAARRLARNGNAAAWLAASAANRETIKRGNGGASASSKYQ